jgi:hypothetical protein
LSIYTYKIFCGSIFFVRVDITMSHLATYTLGWLGLFGMAIVTQQSCPKFLMLSLVACMIFSPMVFDIYYFFGFMVAKVYFIRDYSRFDNLTTHSLLIYYIIYGTIRPEWSVLWLLLSIQGLFFQYIVRNGLSTLIFVWMNIVNLVIGARFMELYRIK